MEDLVFIDKIRRIIKPSLWENDKEYDIKEHVMMMLLPLWFQGVLTVWRNISICWDRYERISI